MRDTKIVATLGPASSSPEILREMILAGVNVVRINFSHGSAQEHIDRVNNVSAFWPICRGRKSASPNSQKKA